MKQSELFTHSTWNILYFKYKEYFVPVSIILGCVLFFIIFLLPQIGAILDRENNVNSSRDQISLLQKNLDILTKSSTPEMNIQLQLVDAAVPETKDFGSIVNAVTRAASASNVSVGDYSLQIGELAGKTITSKNPTVQLGITLLGSPTQVSQFVTTVSHQLPLSDVIVVEGNQKSAAVSLVFYYQPPVKLTVRSNDALSLFSSSDTKTLQTLSAFQAAH